MVARAGLRHSAKKLSLYRVGKRWYPFQLRQYNAG